MKLPIHPAAELLPLMEGAAYKRFVEDIRAQGLIDPITVTPDGQVLDGRNRLRACKELGIPCDQQVADPLSPVAFVISRNVERRRQLSTEQKAFAAVDAAPLLELEALERKAAGGRKGRRGRPDKMVPDRHHLIRDLQGRTSARLGHLFEVGRTSVEHAATIVKKKPKLRAEVLRGEKSLADAAAEAKGREPKPRKTTAKSKTRTAATAKSKPRKETAKARRQASELLGMLDGLQETLSNAKIRAVIMQRTKYHSEWISVLGGVVKRARNLQSEIREVK